MSALSTSCTPCAQAQVRLEPFTLDRLDVLL